MTDCTFCGSSVQLVVAIIFSLTPLPNYFYCFPTSGMWVEATQLESIAAIQKLTVLGLSVAVRTLQMVEGRDDVDLPASMTFSTEQQECLTQLEHSCPC
jgi:hypothetical protein